ncbi:MAG: fibronectin type III domain-containing protein, partial [Candidatus Anstonellales archaeon]
MKKEKKGFSLVELLIVIGSLGALIGIITSVLKPVELFKNSRDIQRINDLNKISAALKEYIALSKNPDLDGPYYDSSGYDEPSSTVFISVPLDVEPTSTNFFIDKNGKAWIINQVKSKNLYKINGEGWIPVNLSEIKYSGLTSYPVDPINSLSKNFFYSYVFKRDIRSFELNANLESTKYRYNGEQDKTSTDGGDDPYIYEVGSTLTILPSEKIYNTERITGLQPKIEISVFDVSINVYIGQTTTTYITVYNNGSTTLTIYNITQKPAKKRIDVDKNYITINPGLKEDLGIICNAKGFNQATVITTTLQLWNNDEANNPKNINITCNIINPPRIYFEPYPINIEAKANQVVTTTFKINNLGGDVLIISSTTMSIGDSEEPCPSWITFSLSAPPPININPNSYITVFVTTSAPASMHNFECRYVIYSNDPLRPASNESINIKVISASEGPTLYAKSGNKEAYLWWELKETGGSPILYYEIFRKTETTEFSKIASVTSTFYTDTGLTNGIKYSYEVRAVNTVGEGYFSNVVSVIPTGTSSPPLNLTATSTNNGICYTGYIRLNWDAPTESGGLPIIKYNIYNSSTESLIGTTTKTTFLVKTTSGYEYSFYVTAVNSAGESDKSNIATTTSYSRPCSPKNLIASATTSSINLTWQSPDYNGGLNINYYNIYMTTSTTWNLIASSTQTNYSYTNVATNTYYFYVTAINSLGEGEASNIASTKWPPTAQPLSPSNLTATPTTTPANRIILNWSSSPTLGIQEYRIYRKSETSYVKIATTSPSILTYPDYNIQKGITYYYYVTAFKNDLESNPSNIASATLITAPSAPLNLEVGICSLNKVNLGWNEPYDKGGVSIIQYNIYRTTSTAYIKIGTTTNLFYSDYSPVKNFINYYYVTAQNIKGEGPSSNIASCNLGGGNCFAKTYGTANYEYLYSLEKTSDGGYVITGATTNYILILKLDSSGNIEWQKSYQYPNPLPTSIKETNDNGYILTGRSNNYDLQQTIVLKLKGNGDVEWAKRYNIISNWPQIIEIEDGYVLSGATYNSCPGYSGMGYFASIVKLDLSGNIQWAKYYCLSPSFSFEIKQKTSDGGYIAITRGSKYIIKLSQTGDIQWLKTYYPNSGSIGFMDITQTNDGYIVSGYYYSDTTYQDIL